MRADRGVARRAVVTVRLIGMEATDSGPRQGIPSQHTEPPEHLVHMLVPLWHRLPTGPAGPMPGTPEYAAAVRAEIRAYVKQIWAEAFHAGMAFGLAWSAQPIRVVLPPGPATDALIETLAGREAVARAQ